MSVASMLLNVKDNWQEPMRKLVDQYRERAVLDLNKKGFRSRWFNTAGGRLHALISSKHGSAPAWIFLHGFSGQGADWAQLLAELGGRCSQILALDMPGHGLSVLPAGAFSPEKMLAGVAEAIQDFLGEDQRCVLVGNSMGGFIATQIASLLGPKVTALVLISPAGAPAESPEQQAKVAEQFMPNSLASACTLVDRLMPDESLVKAMGGRKLAGMMIWAHLSRPHLRQMIANLPSYPALPPETIAALPPTLFIWGDRDYILPVAGRDYFRRHLPVATTRILTPAAYTHTPYADKAGELAAEMLDWAASRGELLPA